MGNKAACRNNNNVTSDHSEEVHLLLAADRSVTTAAELVLLKNRRAGESGSAGLKTWACRCAPAAWL